MKLDCRCHHSLVKGLAGFHNQATHGLLHAAHVGQESHQLALWTQQGRGKVRIIWLQHKGILRVESVTLLVKERHHVLYLGIVAFQKKLQGKEE